MSWRVLLMTALTLFGTGVATYLVTVALDPNKVIACGPVGDCHTVQASQYAEIAGIPVAAFGLAMYVALLALLAARLLRVGSPAVQDAVPQVAFALALGGVLYSAYLTYLELAVIYAICVWCVTSAVTITGVFLLTIPDIRARTGRRAPRPV